MDCVPGIYHFARMKSNQEQKNTISCILELLGGGAHITSMHDLPDMRCQIHFFLQKIVTLVTKVKVLQDSHWSKL